MSRLAWPALWFVSLAACTATTDDVVVQLAPEVISSIDGTLSVRATALAQRDPGDKGQTIEMSVVYQDRNGIAHDIAPIDGTTDDKGVVEGTFTGLTFDGTGTVTATLLSGGSGSNPVMAGGMPVAAEASFAVLDRSPPKIEIVPPMGDLLHVNTDATIQVHVTDEIGVSEVVFETTAIANGGGGGNNNNGRQRSTVVASGSMDSMVSFDVAVSQNATVGTMVTLYALASDLSGNEAAAVPVVVTVAQ